MLAVEVIDDPTAAMVALEPVRSRLLSELAEPASAATLAARGCHQIGLDPLAGVFRQGSSYAE